MKKFKFLIVWIFMILILTVSQTFAQKPQGVDPGINFGLSAGINMQTLYGSKYDGGKLDYKLIFGYQAGVNVILSLAADFFLNPALLFSVKGAKQEILEDTKRTTNLAYMELPVNFLYRPQMGDGHILLGAGPYLAYGIFGKQKEILDGVITEELNVKFKNSTATDYAYFKPIDFGGNLFFGYEFYNGVFCQVNTQLGLYEINPDFVLTGDETSKKNIGFSLSAGYRF
jgi:hypothetical protein